MQLGTRQSDKARAQMSETVTELWAKRKASGWQRKKRMPIEDCYAGESAKTKAERDLVLRMLTEALLGTETAVASEVPVKGSDE